MKQWDEVQRVVSSDDNVLKYVFKKKDAVAESVLYKYPTYEKRTVICCSTQSGCPVGCRFCGAGDSFVRSLDPMEIASQPEHLFEDMNIDAHNIERLQIMFMSMGEPMLNYKSLAVAIRYLHIKYPQAALLVSTSGPRVNYEPMRRLSAEIPTIGLQFSVHESTDMARDLLIPYAHKLTLREIATEGAKWFLATGRQPFFNYCANVNNATEEDADRIAHLFSPHVWQATISVVCERDESIAAANERQRELASKFRAMLGKRGFETRMFDPAGQDDIGGGCGQLWFVQDWMKNNSDLARPSVGRQLPVVHAPRVV